MSEIIKNIPNQVFRTNISYLRWESNDLNIDLTPLVGKNIECAKGTFGQIMDLTKICKVKQVILIGALNSYELLELEKLKSIYTVVTDICEISDVRLKYVIGEITPSSSPESITNMLIACPRISLMMKKSDWVFELVCEHAHRINMLNLYYYITDDQLRILIAKATNLRTIKISRVDQNVINILGESSITRINTKHNTSDVDITPIITNPRIEVFTTRMNCRYDISEAKVTLLEFNYPNPEFLSCLRKKCKVNRKAELLKKLANIKTPNI